MGSTTEGWSWKRQRSRCQSSQQKPLSIKYAATASRQKMLLRCPASTFMKGAQQSSVQGEVNSEVIASVVAYKILKGDPRVTAANPLDETRIMASWQRKSDCKARAQPLAHSPVQCSTKAPAEEGVGEPWSSDQEQLRTDLLGQDGLHSQRFPTIGASVDITYTPTIRWAANHRNGKILGHEIGYNAAIAA